ncbi:hypothetical protein B0H16DRAFT_1729526 [Mycena metata]|uniref:Uncharacterized protein n=1 Tax=Mycena metata TaxID=1033252 RepID=A0AAD7IB47_9AGAR|nr:hypothetical protein B0H16DRAFT_1729526 [Mycena metata]
MSISPTFFLPTTHTPALRDVVKLRPWRDSSGGTISSSTRGRCGCSPTRGVRGANEPGGGGKGSGDGDLFLAFRFFFAGASGAGLSLWTRGARGGQFGDALGARVCVAEHYFWRFCLGILAEASADLFSPLTLVGAFGARFSIYRSFERIYRAFDLASVMLAPSRERSLALITVLRALPPSSLHVRIRSGAPSLNLRAAMRALPPFFFLPLLCSPFHRLLVVILD